jgi:hypothetical protein
VLRRHAGRVRYEPADRVFRRAGGAATAQALDRSLPRDTSDAAGLAPQTGGEEV